MKTRSKNLVAFIPLIMVALLVASASALPVLNVNSPSNANYLLTALAQTTQSCVATPANFSGIACQNSPPGPIFIQVRDDGLCATLSDVACSVSPNSATVNIGQLVVWQNDGKLNHTVTSDSPQYHVDLFLRAPTNSSSPFLIPNSSASYAFASPGTFSYHDKSYPGMTGTITVNSIPAPPPVVRDFTAMGPVNWTVVGLDQENALLSISHHIDVYNTTSNTHSLLASESGVFEDSINLSTRVESADLTRILNSLPYVYGYGFGGGYWPNPPILFSGPGDVLSYPISYYSPPEIYTVWWVNGPLFIGSTVEVLTATGSVRGSQTLNLGTSLGSKDAWVVGSLFKEQFSQPPPIIPPNQNYPQYFRANNSVATSLQLDYGKASDLMLATSDKIDQTYQFGYTYPTGSTLGGGGFYGFPGPIPFFGGGGITLNQPVTVLRTQQTSLTLNLSLASTNIDLNSNANPPITSTNPTNSNPSPGTTNTHPAGSLQGSLAPMLYTITGIIVTSLIGGVLWSVRRTRVSNKSSPQSSPALTASGPQPLT
ncbi:hypothetical protein E6H34_08755 [Candidatus Bathyarchaeota archaeon]|nr:MAG: hypothetical protein E6H34_08755 [Candidatus Bathyarchaeota archaeon]